VRILPFQLAAMLGAFLLFLVQPLIAKQILPWFGGSATVWSACLMFFQVVLVAGYVYAHVTRRLGPARQAAVHLSLIGVAAIVSLPIGASAEWAPPDGAAPVGRVVGVLAAAVGFPAVLLAATAPLVQDWFARVEPGRSPYPLYVVSNIGSLAALVVYPAFVERYLTIPSQSLVWSLTFGAFIAACLWCAARVRRNRVVAQVAADADAAPRSGPVDRMLWIALPAIGSGLLLATSSGLTQDIAPVPLLWVVPLSIYLVTYILAFAGWYSRPVFAAMLVIALGVVQWIVGEDSSTPVPYQVAALLAAFGAACMVCHGELARLRPAVRALTAFYVAIAVGGSLGGAAVALGAPLVFDSYAERPVLTVAAVAALAFLVWRDVARRWPGKVAALVAVTLALAVGGAALVLTPREVRTGQIAAGRSFYGVLSVTDEPADQPRPLRRLYHGRILHGTQFIPQALRRQVTSYYTPGSGIEVALNQHPNRLRSLPLTIGVAGLGAGTVAGWGQTFDQLTFFEIDPLVVEFSQRYFTYVQDSPAHVEIVMGDARLSLERQMRSEQNQHTYDVLAMDAFSGDAIPVHLLTRECFALYRLALKADGILAVHVSNRYVDIKPVVRGAAAELGWQVLEIEKRWDTLEKAISNTWLLVTSNAAFIDKARAYALTDPDTATIVWTDAFSSLIPLLK
jgi:hypothetical protein